MICGHTALARERPRPEQVGFFSVRMTKYAATIKKATWRAKPIANASNIYTAVKLEPLLAATPNSTGQRRRTDQTNRNRERQSCAAGLSAAALRARSILGLAPFSISCALPVKAVCGCTAGHGERCRTGF
jgi:hypothetical protein